MLMYSDLRNVSVDCKCRFSQLGEAEIGPPNPLIGFKGPLRGREKKDVKGEGKEGRDRKNTPKIKFWLQPCMKETQLRSSVA